MQLKKHGNVDIKLFFSCPILFLYFVANILPGIIAFRNMHSDITIKTVKIVLKHHQNSIKLKNKANYVHAVNSVNLFRAG